MSNAHVSIGQEPSRYTTLETSPSGSAADSELPVYSADLKPEWVDPWPVLSMRTKLNFVTYGFILGVIAATTALVANTQRMGPSVQSRGRFGNCRTNGSFVSPQSYTSSIDWDLNPLNPVYLFDITLGFGSLDFSVAKFIDVSWDMVVGRGGQLILVYVTHRVFKKVMLFTMERNAVSYKFFAALALEDNSTYSLWRMIKDREYWKMGPKGCFTILGMILSSIYLISFPTLVSSMTGYTTLYTPYTLIEGFVLLTTLKITSF